MADKQQEGDHLKCPATATVLEESETKPKTGFDMSMLRHRPNSEQTQDVSHVLASIFKDLYTTEVIGRDMSANLAKTKRGGSDYHDKYVEELQQAHTEYTQRIKDADMLENHIIQARLRATATENQVHERMLEEVGETYEQLGILPARSAFVRCVDNDLLKRNNLICPQDYLTKPAPLVEAPAVKSDPHYANPTFTYEMHVCREPQDDDYTPIPGAEKNANLNLDQENSESTLTLEASSDIDMEGKTPSKEPTRVRSRPKSVNKPCTTNMAEKGDILESLKDRHRFLLNPRFHPPNVQAGGKSLIFPRINRAEKKPVEGKESLLDQSSTNEPVPVFLANPPVVVFTSYTVGQVYETTVQLKNLTATSRHVRVIPPNTPYFSIGLGRFPGVGGVIAPGMSCKYTVRFAPDSLAEYEDFIVVETQARYPLLVPIKAQATSSSAHPVLECGYCLVGGVKFVELLCRNDGLSAGTFCIIPKSQWPASNLRSVVTACFAEQPPFAVSPSLFELQPGQATLVEVVFFPSNAEKSSQVFTIVCDNCQVKDLTIQGEGQLIALDLVCVSGEQQQHIVGELHDLTAEHCVRFGPCNPHSLQHKTLVIRNNTHLELPFHWQIMQPNLHALLPGEAPEPSHIHFHPATDDVFCVSPTAGLLDAGQDHEFLFTYFPKELKNHHSVCHLVLRDIPQLPSECSETGSSSQPQSAVNDVIVMEIEVKGSTEAHQVLLEPYAIHIPGELFIGTTTHRKFRMWNHSKSSICFHWDRMSDCHIIEVLPSTGEIEMNECVDLELVVTGGRPEKLVSRLLCHVEHHHTPVTLAVDVTFKGPQVTVSVPSLDLGLLSVGEEAQATVFLTNITQVEASWSLEERRSVPPHHPPQMSVEPSGGVLPPMGGCSVDILFMPHSCQHFDSVLELSVDKGTGCALSVQADVQRPQVCLLSCELVFSELYVGVPAQGVVTLFNQTMLPAPFTWTPHLQGKQASQCTASFQPSSGTLGPNASMDITVTFAAHTHLELTEVAAVCEVQGMDAPVVLGFYSKAKKLSVSYSLSSVRSASATEAQDSSSSVLDFGDDVILKKAVTKQMMITNHTAITAPFTIEAEYFTGHAPSNSQPKEQHQKRSTYSKNPLHSGQARKIEERAYEDFVSSLLAHGKGAAFYVQPRNGMLGPFESQTVDITAYSDMWGEYRDHLICMVGDLEPRLISVQMTVRGCPLYFQMIGPQPDNQNQGPTAQFGTHVSGGDTVSRSLRINNPSPYDIRVDWETYNIDPNDRKLLDVVVAYGEAFSLKDADGNEVVGGMSAILDDDIPPMCRMWDGSHSFAASEGTTLSLQTESDMEGEECVAEEEEEEEDERLRLWHQNKKLISVYVRPHRGNISDYPYCITPQQIVIPKNGSSTIHVSFTPLTLSGPVCESRCVGLALGFMSLDSKMAACIPSRVQRAQGLDLEPVRMDLRATVKPALLSVQMEDDGGVLEFRASASDLLKGESPSEMSVEEFDVTQTFQLRNASEMPLHFTLETQPPFFVVCPRVPRTQRRTKTSRSSNPTTTSEGQTLVLQPQHNMQVKVAFHCSLSLLDHDAKPNGEGVTQAVTPVPSVGGPRRKLTFRRNLLLHYSKNSLQTVPLCAHLYMTTHWLSTDSIDFGTCYVGQTRAIEVHLYSDGAATFWRTVIESDEERGVFTVTPDSGVLRPLEAHANSCRQPLQISFKASEARDFRATVNIQGVLVELPLTLQVKGRGSFDEVFKASLVSM